MSEPACYIAHDAPKVRGFCDKISGARFQDGQRPESVVYDSDLPMHNPRQQLGWVIFSDLPQAVKERVLARNAADIIRPCFERLPQHNRPAFLKNGYR